MLWKQKQVLSLLTHDVFLTFFMFEIIGMNGNAMKNEILFTK